MSELSLIVLPSGTGGGTTFSGTGSTQRISLIRKINPVPAHTSININSPGTNWIKEGDTFTFDSAGSFVQGTQVFRNGQLLYLGQSDTDDADAYTVTPPASGISSIAFEFSVQPNDIIQIWKHTVVS